MQEKTGFGERAVNKVATLAIRRQLKRANSVDVQIKTDLNKLMQGQLDAMTITIQGVLLASQVEAETLRLQISEIAVKPASAVRGKIILIHPSTGVLDIVVSQEKLTDALNSDALLQPLRSLSPDLVQDATLTSVLSENTLTVSAGPLKTSADTPLFVVTTTPTISPDGKTMQLQQVRYVEGQEPSPQFTQSLLEQISDRFSLSDFERKGMRLQIQRLEVSTGKLALNAAADIQQFPS